MRWIVLALFCALLLNAAWLSIRSLRGDLAESVGLQSLQPLAGGMILPGGEALIDAPPLGETAIFSAVDMAPASNLLRSSLPVRPLLDVLVPGQPVVANDPVGVKLYSDASVNAPVMAIYAEGTAFTVLEPSGDYGAYPIEQAGHRWYRLRAADGLIGWVSLN